MKYLLSSQNKELLAQVAFCRALLAFDFDGTLAPIVKQYDSAQMHSTTARLFAKLCTLYPCAIISGREKIDVIKRVGGAVVKYIIGNHGLEPGANLDEYEKEVRQAFILLRNALHHEPGIDFEDKRYSLALHYRRSRQKQHTREIIHQTIATLPMRMRIIPGKLVMNIVPNQAPNKGDALLELRAIEQADMALYVGDDVTDEDVFKLDQPGRLLTIRIGHSKLSTAAYYLRNQQETNQLLMQLISFRKKCSVSQCI